MIKFTLTREGNEQNKDLDRSKLFGSPTFPLDFMSKKGLNDDYFFAQINLDEIKDYQNVLPKEGMLYFFLRPTKYSFKAKVLYTKEELGEVMGEVNEMFGDLCFNDALYMNFNEGEGHHYLLDGFDQEVPEADRDDYVVLLKVDPLNVLASDFPIFNNPDDELYFVILKEDLEKLDFRKVKFIAHGS